MNTTAFCAICQKETGHDVNYEVAATDPSLNMAIKLTCENTSPDREHAIRMSPNVTSKEVEKILMDHEVTFKGNPPLTDDQVKAEQEQKLTELFN